MYYRKKLFEFYNHNTYSNAKIPIYLDISLSYLLVFPYKIFKYLCLPKQFVDTKAKIQCVEIKVFL